MIEILKAILFGIVEGITEWLPISSTGHMILLNEFVTLDVSDEFWSMFEVVIQLGAILAVVCCTGTRFSRFIWEKRQRNTMAMCVKMSLSYGLRFWWHVYRLRS